MSARNSPNPRRKVGVAIR